jgi:molybdate transport system substrate-binding protein
LIDGMNRAAGSELVTTRTGGEHGGGAGLTDRGRFAVATFRGLLEQVQRVAESTLHWLTGPEADTIHVACATSLESVLRQLIVDFSTREPGITVRAITGASNELADHLAAGAPADLFLSADPGQLDRLRDAGILDAASQATLAHNSLVAIGAPRGPAIRSANDLSRPAVRRIAVGDPGCPLGAYTRAYLEPLGLWDTVRERAVFLDNPAVVLAAVRAGNAEVGLVYRSDAAAAHSRVLFRARTAAVRYSVALTHRGAAKPAARSLLAFLTSPVARQRFRRNGFLLKPG